MDGPGHLAEQLTVLFEAPLATMVGDRRYGIYVAPVGARRAARSALQGWEPAGPEALAEDLNGRLGHAWLAQANGPAGPPSTSSARASPCSPAPAPEPGPTPAPPSTPRSLRTCGRSTPAPPPP
jgi:hypothetical protein